MGNLHEVVVDDVSQMVCRQLVSTLVKHLVVDDVALDTHLATDKVVDQHLLSGLNLEADNVLVAGSNQRIDLFLREGQRVAHLATCVAIVLKVLNLGTLCLQLLRRIESDVSLVVVEQLLHVLLIDVATLALTVGTFVATKADALVELDAQPFERLDDILLGTRHETVGIGVLNTEHQIAAMLACKKEIIQGGTYATDM